MKKVLMILLTSIIMFGCSESPIEVKENSSSTEVIKEKEKEYPCTGQRYYGGGGYNSCKGTPATGWENCRSMNSKPNKRCSKRHRWECD